MYIYVCLFVYICTYVCIYIYICVHMYVNTYLCMYRYITCVSHGQDVSIPYGGNGNDRPVK